MIAPTPLDLADYGLKRGEMVAVIGWRGQYKVLSAAGRDHVAWINLYGGVRGREMLRSVTPDRILKSGITRARPKRKSRHGST